MSLFGDLKYPPGFKQFEYVNANAPKGGTARQIAIGTFDNFNSVVCGRQRRDRIKRCAHLRHTDDAGA